MDKIATNTYNKNLRWNCFAIKLDLSFEYPNADIIIGGPSCQPFSVGEAIGETMLTPPEGSKFLNEAQDRYVANYEKA